jgi:hypothetical protein
MNKKPVRIRWAYLPAAIIFGWVEWTRSGPIAVALSLMLAIVLIYVAKSRMLQNRKPHKK